MRNAFPYGRLCLLAAAVFAAVAAPAFAEHETLPALDLKGYPEASIHPIDQAKVEAYVAALPIVHTFDVYEGQNQALMDEMADEGMTVLARGFSVDLPSAQLFDERFEDDGFYVSLAGIVSIDALSLRLLVDLSSLQDEEEVWVIDTVEPRAFGPFFNIDHVDGGRWLPTTGEALTVLMVRSPSPDPPEIRLLGVSHFFNEPTPLKQLSCNVNIACEGSPTVQGLSAGVGYMIIPCYSFLYGHYTVQCTGTLITNPTTATIEPFLLTSDHCIEDYTDARQIEVVWDYRSASCDTNSAPSLASLPRSYGSRLLKTSGLLDITLLLLQDVPNGAHGRAWLMWNDSVLSPGQRVICMHHPEGSHMRISSGTIVAVGQRQNGHLNQIKVHWDSGVTEPGSSGSALLLAGSNYEIVGTLSSGTVHSCLSNVNNVDWYSSFRHFFPDVDECLEGTDPPLDGGTSDCAFETAFKNDEDLLKQFRALRDKGLLNSSWGKVLIDSYYKAAPGLVRVFERSPAVKDLFIATTTPLAGISEGLE